jgi:peroxiredoxin
MTAVIRGDTRRIVAAAVRSVVRGFRSRHAGSVWFIVLLVAMAVPRLRPETQAIFGGDATSAKPAPALRLATVSDDTIAVGDLTGSVVLLVYWASWCGDCRRDLPDIQALHVSRSLRGLVTVGLSTDDTRGAAEGFVRARGVTFPIAMAGAAERRPFGVVSIPTTVLIDRRSRVRHIFRGSISRAALGKALDRLLAEGNGLAPADPPSLRGDRDG